jgi:hypothetical protein
MPRDNIWSNSDGLRVGFGKHTEDNQVASVFQGANGEVTVTLEIDMASLVATSAEAANMYPANLAAGNQHVIPRGSIIKGGYIEVLVACTGAGGDADFGTWSYGLATEVVDDSNGLKDSVLVIADADDSNLAVAGAISNSDVIITGSYTTAYTAGRVKLVVTYIPPTGSSGRVIAV